LLRQRAFSGCSGIVSINFNTDAELAIGEGAFENLSALGYLYLDGVKSVGDRAFSGAGSLEWIEIDRKVEEIGSWAFSNCQLLDKVYAHSEWPARITINTFDTATEQRSTLYVFPEACERYA
ncbi:MAG: leucine-rich repeat domain-containing protein, partial [Muribaculaceae bacterium]|nr:leucine-rich repeat domain-containing protein [Muribaculaceae bacterium]